MGGDITGAKLQGQNAPFMPLSRNLSKKQSQLCLQLLRVQLIYIYIVMK